MIPTDPDYFPSRMYGYVRSRQLEGTYNDDPSIGVWVTTANRINKGWGWPPEAAWPYDGRAENWPPVEPPGMDWMAKQRRVGAYQRARSIQDMKVMTYRESLVLLAVGITDQWFNAKKGIIKMPKKVSDINNEHSIVIIGYNDAKARFTIRNSWGAQWGDQGNGYLPYEYVEKYFSDAWAITILQDTYQPASRSGTYIFNWGLPDLLGTTMHGIEIYNCTNNEFVGWTFCLVHKKFLDIEEFFIRPNYRNNGNGKQLLNDIHKLASSLKLPIRFLVPFSDIDAPNLEIFKKLIGKDGIKLKNSQVTWCKYFGVK